MSSVVISGDTSGSVTLSAPAVAGSPTITLPSGSGTLTLPSGTGTVTVNGVNSNIVAGTAVASTSGTSITFTGIPSWAKRITIMLNSVSTSGTNAIQAQIGSGSMTTTGYSSAGVTISTTSNSSTSTTGFIIGAGGGASDVINGAITIYNISANIWIANAVTSQTNAFMRLGSGILTSLSGALDRVALTTVGGTDTFDAGSINILYE